MSRRRGCLDARVIWLGLGENVKEHYCEPSKEPDEYKIPKKAIIISDLGDEGQLLLMSNDDYDEMSLTESGKRYKKEKLKRD